MTSLSKNTTPTTLAQFQILTTTYKTVHDHEITTDILIPPSLSTNTPRTPRPILLRYHGGGLIAGSSLFPAFFNPWYLELAETHQTIIVSPNYRLLPEATFEEIMGDIEDHWQWMHRTMPSFLATQTNGRLAADLDRIITGGDSAGGYLSLQTALDHPDMIRAVTATYPMVVVKSDQMAGDYGKTIYGLPSYPRSTLADHLVTVKEREMKTGQKVIVTADHGEKRLQLMFAICQHGLAGPLLSADPRMYPLDRLELGARFPRGGMLVLHGSQDSVVPVQESYLLKEVVQKVQADLDFKLIIREGEHGFDHGASLQDEWLQDGVRGIVDSWFA
ncbi:uncharacterized protein KD926_002855 [Aspergillus affinis]|uniref:uncharacterized protein n=1 Tax=Aspergillus affinis TaxID=1070780 RepID=UPI0022FF251B|nr:uncharacterized protein KD926_002855 [Aspergillus affinis]KAI9035826.1 hypothetical protein KD926_002855 [Aspergillus affinis]